MTTGKLPDPKAAGPIAGQPGHFAHHDWLEGAVGVLDERLMKCFSAVTVVTVIPTGVNTPIVFDTVPFDTGLDISIVAAGGVLMGPGAPEGYYRMDVQGSFVNAAGTGRRLRLFVNGVDQSVFYCSVSPPTGSNAAILNNSGIVYLPAAATIQPQIWHNAGVNVNSQTSSQNRMFMEYLGPGPAVNPEQGEEIPMVDSDAPDYVRRTE